MHHGFADAEPVQGQHPLVSISIPTQGRRLWESRGEGLRGEGWQEDRAGGSRDTWRGSRCEMSQAVAWSFPGHSRQEGPQTVENEGKRRRPERLPREHDVRPGWPREGRQDGKGGHKEGWLPGGCSVTSEAQGESRDLLPSAGL